MTPDPKAVQRGIDLSRSLPPEERDVLFDESEDIDGAAFIRWLETGENEQRPGDHS